MPARVAGIQLVNYRLLAGYFAVLFTAFESES